MTKTQIQVDAEEFWPSLRSDILSAREHVYVQTLSFEGDSVGEALADALSSSSAPDRRVVVDEFYTLHRINDNFLHSPLHWFNTSLREERDKTLAMHAALVKKGIGVRLANPSGPILVKFLRRNHKKIIVIDDRVSYIGGMNFTEHNFSWHDMMLRIEDPTLARFLKDDFLETWEGRNTNTSQAFGNIRLHRFDGVTNRKAFQPIIDLIASARESIYIISPYIAYPFYEALRTALKGGAKVVLLTPDHNNWPTIREYVIWESARAGVDLRLYPGRMMHLKAMLIDDRYLIAGSSNFDFLSSELMQEIVAVITDEPTIAEFKRKVLNADLQHAVPNTERISNLRGLYHIARLKAMTAVVGALDRVLTFGR
jgi:cardiolipin synthase